jgi:Trp operon repressor
MERKYFLKSKGKLYEVSKELHDEIEKMDRRFRYVKKRDKENGLFFVGDWSEVEENIVDNQENTEETALKNILMKNLNEELLCLSADELYLINKLVCKTNSKREIARKLNMPYSTFRRCLSKLQSRFQNFFELF